MRPRSVPLPVPVPPPPPPGGILRREGRGAGTRQVRFAPLAEEEEEEDEAAAGVPVPVLPSLATPTLHSSRRGGPGAAPPEPFDAARAAAALLGRSFSARSALGGAAAAAMNVPQTQRLFRGLVSLAVPPPPGLRRGVPGPPAAPPQAPGPDLGALAGAGGDTGTGTGTGWPWLPPAPPPRPPRPLPRPPGAVFSMYQKLHLWGGR